MFEWITNIKMVGEEAGDPEWKTSPAATHTMARISKYDEQETYPEVI